MRWKCRLQTVEEYKLRNAGTLMKKKKKTALLLSRDALMKQRIHAAKHQSWAQANSDALCNTRQIIHTDPDLASKESPPGL